MIRFLLPLLFLLLPPAALAQTPAVLEAAMKDAESLPPKSAHYVRYLALGHIEPGQRESAYLVLSGHCQHLSTAPDIVRPVIVPGTAGALLRLDLRDYNWSVKTWEQLAEADPYFHLRVTTVVTQDWPGGVWAADGQHYAPGAFRYKTKKTKATLFAGRGDPKHMVELARLTYSEAPILFGDWFFNQTAVAVDRKPNYYDFLGVRDQKTFEDVIGFDKKLAKKFGNDLRASVEDSSVTLQPRAIIRQATLGGAYWKTLDFRKAVGDNNPLKILGQDIEKGADALEVYGHLPNGFFATGLFNNKGVRQDTAPDFIASDSVSKSTDRRVHVNVSCVRCHAGSGLQPIDDWTRNLLQPPLAGKSYDHDKLLQIRREYLRSLEPFLDRDRRIFADAVKEATGMTVKEYSNVYSRYWEKYEDKKFTLIDAAAYAGVHPAKLHEAISASVATGQGDPSLSIFLVRGLRLRTIGVRQFEELYPQIHVLLGSVKK